MYERRFYRDWMARDGLHRFAVRIGESDLLILCDRDLQDRAARALAEARGEIERQIAGDRQFATALEPIDRESESPVVGGMLRAGRAWNVGPMAAVAGAVAEAVGRHLLARCETAIVENGGDVFVRSAEPVTFAVYAGERSPFRDRVAFEVDASRGVGVCTSSGVVGPSLSFGRADAVVAIAADTAFADAAATAIANRIREPDDVDRVVEAEAERGALDGLIACLGDRIGLWGEVELVRT
jgi:ApbE superfamily uncharacterized protein (UPF0280 family)